jgi:hypothetical protein
MEEGTVNGGGAGPPVESKKRAKGIESIDQWTSKRFTISMDAATPVVVPRVATNVRLLFNIADQRPGGGCVIVTCQLTGVEPCGYLTGVGVA